MGFGKAGTGEKRGQTERFAEIPSAVRTSFCGSLSLTPAANHITRRGNPRPSFLFPDEPLSGIDLEQALETRNIILGLNRNRIGVRATRHNVKQPLAAAGRAYRAGSPESLGQDPEVKRVYLGRPSAAARRRSLIRQIGDASVWSAPHT
jgi:hypothetical protein